jgi:hypothetical protein
MPPEVVADGDGDGQDRERYSPFAWDVFSMGMVGDRPSHWRRRPVTVAVASAAALTALLYLGRGRQVLYYMWTGRHPLDEYVNVFTRIREIGKGSRWAAHRRARACTSAAGETSHDSAALPPTPPQARPPAVHVGSPQGPHPEHVSLSRPAPPVSASPPGAPSLFK